MEKNLGIIQGHPVEKRGAGTLTRVTSWPARAWSTAPCHPDPWGATKGTSHWARPFSFLLLEILSFHLKREGFKSTFCIWSIDLFPGSTLIWYSGHDYLLMPLPFVPSHLVILNMSADDLRWECRARWEKLSHPVLWKLGQCPRSAPVYVLGGQSVQLSTGGMVSFWGHLTNLEKPLTRSIIFLKPGTMNPAWHLL